MLKLKSILEETFRSQQVHMDLTTSLRLRFSIEFMQVCYWMEVVESLLEGEVNSVNFRNVYGKLFAETK